jgi:L-asparagine transporter-like permease
MIMDTAPSDADAKLIRGIGLTSATLLVVTNVIGSAIFLTPGSMAATLPSEPLLLLAWVVGGVIALCGGLTYAEMGAMFPRSGGLYIFLEEAYGPLIAFLFGWTGMLVILTGSVATVAVGFAKYFSYFVPSLSTANEVVALGLPWGVWSISASQILAAVSILALGAVNYVGVKSGNRLQATLTVVKIAALAALPIVAVALHPVTPSFTPLVPPIANPAAAFGVVMIAVMWAYEGWYYVPFCAGEIKEARRAVPIALVVGIAALVVIYVSANVAYMLALPLSEIQGVERIAEKAVTALVGPRGAAIVAATVVVSTLGCNAAAVIAMSRACYGHGGRRDVLSGRGRRAPEVPHAACRDRDDVRVVRVADADRHLRAVVHLGDLRVGDLRRAWRGRDLPAATTAAGYRAALPDLGLPAGAGAVCRRPWRARLQHGRRKAGRVGRRRGAGRARPAGVHVLVAPPGTLTRTGLRLPEPSPWSGAGRKHLQKLARIAWHTS